MDYHQTLTYLFAQLPMYQRMGNAAYKSDLTNTIELCKVLGNPENKFKSVHIAGTNGKGSTSHMLAAVFQNAGYQVGLYTSPHLKDFRERVKINGEMIPEADVVDFVKKYKSQFEQINLSFFEWTVGLAFSYFADKKVDIAIVETGLGGRLDSTNVVTPELSIITNIGIDHTQFLGETLIEIAGEKAGIIKKNVPIIISEEQAEIKSVFIDKSQALDAPIHFASEVVKEIYSSDLKGVYQTKNIKAVVLATQLLAKKGWNITDKNLKQGLQNVVKNTGLLGRWQTLSNNPLVICDTGHNEAGIKEVINHINQLEFEQLHFVYGAVNDKSIDKILDLLPKSASYYFCEAKIPRALNVHELYAKAIEKGLNGKTYKSVEEALVSAKQNATQKDLIFVGGSTFVVAEVV